MRAGLLALTLLLGACTHHAFVSDRLYCGLSVRDGGSVSEEQIESFLREVVEPRFPDGFTVWRARGQWRGGGEEAIVIEIVRPRDARLERLIEEIAEEYRVRFRQEAVLRVTLPARMWLLR